jgi:hypothetical protein
LATAVKDRELKREKKERKGYLLDAEFAANRRNRGDIINTTQAPFSYAHSPQPEQRTHGTEPGDENRFPPASEGVFDRSVRGGLKKLS